MLSSIRRLPGVIRIIQGTFAEIPKIQQDDIINNLENIARSKINKTQLKSELYPCKIIYTENLKKRENVMLRLYASLLKEMQKEDKDRV